MATGAVLGGVLGRQIGHGSGREETVATIGGAALGAFFGSHVGRKIDEEGVGLENVGRAGEIARRALHHLAQPEQRTSYSYSVRPTRTYDGPTGACRDFAAVTEIDKVQGRGHRGHACRQPDGSWRAS